MEKTMVQMTALIEKKKAGQALNAEEIKALVNGYAQGEIPDYQMSAFLMAVYFKGMEAEELGQFTLAMVESGDQIDFSAIDGYTVDKHSTGGVGDSTSLILVPLVAACGACVPKMSGRSLGHTGGTIDKLEAIPGFQVELEEGDFIRQVNQLGCAIVGQSGQLAPADKKIYALRDVTATVDAIPLIASSIMSKKIASGADGIVLDVKVGQGAFMKNLDQAKALAQTMIEIGQHAGKQVTVIISDMSQPLGGAIGNSLEVQEAIAVLQGQGPTDLKELSLTLASHMVAMSQGRDDLPAVRQTLEEVLESGQALEVFKQMVEAQGGDGSYVDDPDRFEEASYQVHIQAPRDGVISRMDALALGQLAKNLGAGRQSLDEAIDLSAGILLEKKVGDAVTAGDRIAVLHTNQSQWSSDLLEQAVFEAIDIGSSAQPPQLIHHIYPYTRLPK